MGLPGIVLLLLRVLIGSVLLLQAVACLSGSDSQPALLFAAASGGAAGILLCAGFLTPAAGSGAIGIALLQAANILPRCATQLDARVESIFGIAILLAITVLGPGAYSADARLFGRREIIIPPVRK